MSHMKTAFQVFGELCLDDPEITPDEAIDFVNFEFSCAWMDFLINNAEDLPMLRKAPQEGIAMPKNFLLDHNFPRYHDLWDTVKEFYNFKRDLKLLRKAYK